MAFVNHPETELMVATITNMGRCWMLMLADGHGNYVGTEWHPSREAALDGMRRHMHAIGLTATIRAQVAPGRWEDVPRRSEANN